MLFVIQQLMKLLHVIMNISIPNNIILIYRLFIIYIHHLIMLLIIKQNIFNVSNNM